MGAYYLKELIRWHTSPAIGHTILSFLSGMIFVFCLYLQCFTVIIRSVFL